MMQAYALSLTNAQQTALPTVCWKRVTALEAIKHETPDVIVSDIRMPGIDGLELIKAVHDIDENIPFIIMTAHSDLSAAIDAYEEGSSYVL